MIYIVQLNNMLDSQQWMHIIIDNVWMNFDFVNMLKYFFNMNQNISYSHNWIIFISLLIIFTNKYHKIRLSKESIIIWYLHINSKIFCI